MSNRSLTERGSDAVRHTIESVGEKIDRGTIPGTILNTFCNVIGGGVLSMAFAMHNASMGIGVILLLYSALCSGIGSYFMAKGCDSTGQYSMNDVLAFALFPRSTRAEFELSRSAAQVNDDVFLEYEAHELKKERRRGYVDLVMNAAIFFLTYGVLVVYGVVISESIPPVVSSFLHGSGFWVERYAWLLMGGVVFFALSCARRMEELKWTSLVGFVTILYVIVLVCVRYFTITDERRHSSSSGAEAHHPDTDSVDVSYWKFTLSSFNAITTYSLAFGYHNNIPYFYRELRNRTPRRFMITVAVCLPITTLCYGAVGILGYLTFGAQVASAKSGGNIMSNFAADDVAVNVGRLGLFLHFVTVYPLASVSCRRNLHRLLFRLFLDKREPQERLALLSGEASGEDDPAEDPTRLQIVIEAAFLVSSAAALAYFVPGVGVVIEVSGCLFGIFLMYFVPSMVGIRIHGERFLPKNVKGDLMLQFGDPNRTRYRGLAIFLLVSGVFFFGASVTSLTATFIGAA